MPRTKPLTLRPLVLAARCTAPAPAAAAPVRTPHVEAALIDQDGRVGRLYGARTTPHMDVIDPQGRLVYAGAVDDRRWASAEETKSAQNHVRAALGEAMAGKPVSVPATTPYGCSVKY